MCFFKILGYSKFVQKQEIPERNVPRKPGNNQPGHSEAIGKAYGKEIEPEIA